MFVFQVFLVSLALFFVVVPAMAHGSKTNAVVTAPTAGSAGSAGSAVESESVGVEVTPSTIPKVIYKTGPRDYAAVDPVLKAHFRTILRANPGYRLRYFSDDQCLALVQRHSFDAVVDAYRTRRPPAYRADLFRYCVLYIYGGIYSDLTQDFQVPLAELVDGATDRLVLVDDLVFHAHGTPGIQINFIAARPRHPIFAKAIARIVEHVHLRYYGVTPLDPTGPYLCRNVYDEYIRAHPSERARIDLVQQKATTHLGPYVAFKRDGRVAFYNKMAQHNAFIQKTPENAYSHLWKYKRIYATTS